MLYFYRLYIYILEEQELAYVDQNNNKHFVDTFYFHVNILYCKKQIYSRYNINKFENNCKYYYYVNFLIIDLLIVNV